MFICGENPLLSHCSHSSDWLLRLLFTTSCFDCWRLFGLDCHFYFFLCFCVCFLVLYAFSSRLLERSFGCHEKERFSSHLIGWELLSIGKPLRIAMSHHTSAHKHTRSHTQLHTMFSLSMIYLDSEDVAKFSTASLCRLSIPKPMRVPSYVMTVMPVQIQHMKLSEVLNRVFKLRIHVKFENFFF